MVELRGPYTLPYFYLLSSSPRTVSSSYRRAHQEGTVRSTMAISLLAAMLASQALANDSTAELATGGLVLVESPHIEMRSEDLFISTSEVRARYEFFNASANDVSTLVAFPMPDITIKEPDDNVSVPTEDPENLLGFTTWVDGHPVTASVEQKVFARGVERTDVLRALKIPLAPHLRTTGDALDRLPKRNGANSSISASPRSTNMTSGKE